jgi:GDPmannose 4,6-dehydratase
MVRRSSSFNRWRIDHLSSNPAFHLFYGDLSDSSSMSKLVLEIRPDEIYNLGAQSHVGISFQMPEYTSDVTALGTLRLLDVLRETNCDARFYQASTSELYGKVREVPQTEKTPFHPRSPYAVSKLFSYWITVNYRESYGMFACNGILFNHESPRRGENFITRKITLNLARVKLGTIDHFCVGNLDAGRDWGYAPDYVEGMWRVLQHDQPDDYVLATNETHTVREFIEEAARCLDMEIVWEGRETEERGVDRKTGKDVVRVDARFFRPAEVDRLQGDPSRACNELGWQPKTRFHELVRIMVEADFEREKQRT